MTIVSPRRDGKRRREPGARTIRTALKSLKPRAIRSSQFSPGRRGCSGADSAAVVRWRSAVELGVRRSGQNGRNAGGTPGQESPRGADQIALRGGRRRRSRQANQSVLSDKTGECSCSPYRSGPVSPYRTTFECGVRAARVRWNSARGSIDNVALDTASALSYRSVQHGCAGQSEGLGGREVRTRVYGVARGERCLWCTTMYLLCRPFWETVKNWRIDRRPRSYDLPETREGGEGEAAR